MPIAERQHRLSASTDIFFAPLKMEWQRSGVATYATTPLSLGMQQALGQKRK
jgi:hypothetical protein